MNTSEKMEKEINSPEELSEPEVKEGELDDETVEEATGGVQFWAYQDSTVDYSKPL